LLEDKFGIPEWSKNMTANCGSRVTSTNYPCKGNKDLESPNVRQSRNHDLTFSRSRACVRISGEIQGSIPQIGHIFRTTFFGVLYVIRPHHQI
jgi:hypothetical protein